MARTSRTLSRNNAVEIITQLVKNVKYKSRNMPTSCPEVLAMRGLALDLINDIYYEMCSDKAQDKIRAEAVADPAVTSSTALLLKLAKWE